MPTTSTVFDALDESGWYGADLVALTVLQAYIWGYVQMIRS